jgi:hypothetical protein
VCCLLLFVWERNVTCDTFFTCFLL